MKKRNEKAEVRTASSSLIPTSPLPQSSYAPIFHHPGTDKLAGVINLPVKRDAIGRSYVESEGLKLILPNYDELIAPGASWLILFYALCLKFTSQNEYIDRNRVKYERDKINRTVEIPFSEYAKLLAIERISYDTKSKVKKRAEKDLEILRTCQIEIKEKDGTITYIPLYAATSVKESRDVIRFVFSEALAELLVTSFIAHLPLAIFAFRGQKKAELIQLAIKLSMHASNRANQKAGRANILSVMTLLRAVPSIPKYEEVRDKDRAVSRHIREPLENLLDTLSEDGILTWSYRLAKGADAPDDVLLSPRWEDYSKLYVWFEFAQPEQFRALVLGEDSQKQKKMKPAKGRRRKADTNKDENPDNEPPLLQ